MNVVKILHSVAMLALLVLVSHVGSVHGFREMATVLEGFLKTGGWVITTGQPFSIQSIFRHDLEPAPVYDQSNGPIVGLPAPTPLCLDDGGGVDRVGFELTPCGSNVENQLFTFNLTSYSLHSASKPSMCATLDAAGSKSAGAVALHMEPCDFANLRQKFMYNIFTYQWIQAEPTTAIAESQQSWCLDDGGGDSDTPVDVGVAHCRPFGAMSQTLMVVPGPTSELPPAPEDGTPKLFAIGFPFRLRLFSSFLCVSDNGEGDALNAEPCTFNPSASQTFAYDPFTSQIKSVAKPWLCLSDSEDADGVSTVELRRCVAGDDEQQFEFDENTGVLTNPTKIGKCLDTNGQKYPEKSPLAMRPCHEHNWNQVFTVEGVSPLPPPEVPETGRRGL